MAICPIAYCDVVWRLIWVGAPYAVPKQCLFGISHVLVRAFMTLSGRTGRAKLPRLIDDGYLVIKKQAMLSQQEKNTLRQVRMGKNGGNLYAC
eukprot:5309353-Amphidinium_carterae.1